MNIVPRDGCDWTKMGAIAGDSVGGVGSTYLEQGARVDTEEQHVLTLRV